jgi:hypothetical protein
MFSPTHESASQKYAIEQQSTLTTKGSIWRDVELISEIWKAWLCMTGFSGNTNRNRKGTLLQVISVTVCVNGLGSGLQNCSVPHLSLW